MKVNKSRSEHVEHNNSYNNQFFDSLENIDPNAAFTQAEGLVEQYFHDQQGLMPNTGNVLDELDNP